MDERDPDERTRHELKEDAATEEDDADPAGVENPGGWLTTVIARVCLDSLRSRRARREEPSGARLPEPTAVAAHDDDPEHQALMGAHVRAALIPPGPIVTGGA